jgi:hypothetical protein
VRVKKKSLRASFRKLFDARRLLVAHFGYVKKTASVILISSEPFFFVNL